MTAGRSAGEQARKAESAARALRRKAQYAEHVATSYAKGAVGEEAVADALRPLEGTGWRILHDRQDPAGGNIDHLAVGPPGVAVIDAKNWTSAVSVSGQRLLDAKGDRTNALDHLTDMVERVRGILLADGSKVAVRGYLALTGDADRGRMSEDIGDLRIVGVDHLAKRLGVRRVDLEPDEIAAISDALHAALPAAGSAAPAGSQPGELHEPSALFDRAHRFYYLRSWKRGANHRIYLSGPEGGSLGWSDVKTGAVRLECSGQEAKFAEALLDAVDPTGLHVAPGDVPKVATKLWGGRLLSRVARFQTSLMVGQEWRGHGKHRIYGYLIDPSVSTFALGWIDAKTGERHPSVTGDIAKDRGPADRYLAYLWTRWPHRESNSAPGKR